MGESVETKACRLCLDMDCNLLSIDVQLENIMKSILGQNISYDSGLPKYACDECAKFLGRFKAFRDKCLKAQTVLYNVLKSASKITDSEIKKLNRTRLKLDVPLSPPPPSVQEEVVEPIRVEIPCVTVKLEPKDVEMETEEHFEEDDDSLNDSNPLESKDEKKRRRRPKKDIKQEVKLEPEELDISEGFTISVPSIKNVKTKTEPSDDDKLPYHCSECCQGSANEDSDHKCPADDGDDCPFEFDTPEEYGVHNMRHLTYKCRRCSFSTKELGVAQEHRQEKHYDDVYCCPFCVFRTHESSTYKEHASDRHPHQVVCRACGHCFTSERELTLHHTRVHREGTPYIRNDLLVSEEIDEDLFCETCSIQFSTTAAWQRHIDAGHYYVVNDEAKPSAQSKRLSYPLQKLGEAFEAVTTNRMAVREAARRYNVPRSTLQYAVRNGTLRNKHGPSPIFGNEEEELVNYVVKTGYLNKNKLLLKAKQLAKKTQREHCFKKGGPGMSWFKCFLRRHPELKQFALRDSK